MGTSALVARIRFGDADVTDDGRRDMSSSTCLSCGRPLSNPESVSRGYGPVCWESVRVALRGTYLDSAVQDALSRVVAARPPDRKRSPTRPAVRGGSRVARGAPPKKPSNVGHGRTGGSLAPAAGLASSWPLVGHTGQVTAMAFGTLPDGRAVLATASADTTVHLWDAARGVPLGRPLVGHPGPVTAMAFGTLPGDRAVLASASNDQTVRIWVVSQGSSPDSEPKRRTALSQLA